MNSLTDYTLSLPTDHPEAAPNDRLTKAASLFSRANVQRFVAYYFRDYSPHNAVLHPWTFDTKSVSPYLLTVIVVTGALFGPCEDEVTQARDIIGLVEEYVFSDANFKKLLAQAGSPRDSYGVQEWHALQASFFITQVQLQEGSQARKEKARTSRFEEIICAVRALGLLDARDTFYHDEPPNAKSFNWNEYGDNEAKIRLVYGIFNLDSSFSILYNISPRLFLEELSIDMAGPMEAFFA